jgi:hypothetical protein
MGRHVLEDLKASIAYAAALSRERLVAIQG